MAAVAFLSLTEAFWLKALRWHSGGDNFVFVDGHAAWESSSVYSNGFPAGTANANSE